MPWALFGRPPGLPPPPLHMFPPPSLSSGRSARAAPPMCLAQAAAPPGGDASRPPPPSQRSLSLSRVCVVVYTLLYIPSPCSCPSSPAPPRKPPGKSTGPCHSLGPPFAFSRSRRPPHRACQRPSAARARVRAASRALWGRASLSLCVVRCSRAPPVSSHLPSPSSSHQPSPRISRYPSPAPPSPSSSVLFLSPPPSLFAPLVRAPKGLPECPPSLSSLAPLPLPFSPSPLAPGPPCAGGHTALLLFSPPSGIIHHHRAALNTRAPLSPPFCALSLLSPLLALPPYLALCWPPHSHCVTVPFRIIIITHSRHTNPSPSPSFVLMFCNFSSDRCSNINGLHMLQHQRVGRPPPAQTLATRPSSSSRSSATPPPTAAPRRRQQQQRRLRRRRRPRTRAGGKF